MMLLSTSSLLLLKDSTWYPSRFSKLTSLLTLLPPQRVIVKGGLLRDEVVASQDLVPRLKLQLLRILLLLLRIEKPALTLLVRVFSLPALMGGTFPSLPLRTCAMIRADYVLLIPANLPSNFGRNASFPLRLLLSLLPRILLLVTESPG